MRPLAAAGVLAALCAPACEREKPVPLAPAASQTGQGGLRPMTSRDDAAPSPAAAPAAPGELPPGHPPIDAAPTMDPHGGATVPGGATAVSGEPVSGTITLSPKLGARPSGSEVLYVIARSAASRQVLAVRREQGVKFPFAFTISGADAMVAGMAFAGPFEITARLSRSGDAIPAAGDIEGTANNVAAGAKTVVVVLDTVRQ